jgi:hypothetical protein
VQDRYAGDLGDYLKFGLLRWLAPPATLKFGVVWYRTADESHNADGKHIGYLDSRHPSSARLREFDPDLHARLAGVVAVASTDVVFEYTRNATRPASRAAWRCRCFSRRPSDPASTIAQDSSKLGEP